jgi:hypothetical protein
MLLMVNLHNLLEVVVFMKFFECTKRNNLTFMHNCNGIAMLEEVDCMSRKNLRFSLADTFKHLLKNFLSYFSIQS